jgi:hypothetical protein
MTFGCRRTGIFESEVVVRILREDGYREIPSIEVASGDVIIYYDDDGDLEHSGIVTESPRPETLNVPTVRSKWAKYKEIIHLANRCPYNFANVKYYRVAR